MMPSSFDGLIYPSMPIAVIYIASAMLFLVATPLPYGYYILLRLAGTVVFIWAATVAHERHNTVLPWVLGIFALLFNPVFNFTKEIWAALDIAAGILLLAAQQKIKTSSREIT